ncbi:MAG: aquaporin, partial [Thermoanaerobaculia bacterium]|nr:aquaporin [Thermoanaerobaculia bacterium]
MATRLSTALTAEFLGTFALVFVGAGAGAIGLGGLVGVALAHGLTLAGFIYAYGHLSGTHVNPAVTFGAWLAGAIDLRRALSYWV